MSHRIVSGVLAGVLGFAAIGSAPASAHHSFAMFDRDKKTMIEGTVKQWDWENPHSWLMITAANGQQWGFEAASLSELVRRGWTKTAVKQGDKISVLFSPRKDGSNGGQLLAVTLPDGKTLASMGPPPGAGAPPAGGPPAAAPPAN